MGLGRGWVQHGLGIGREEYASVGGAPKDNWDCGRDIYGDGIVIVGSGDDKHLRGFLCVENSLGSMRGGVGKSLCALALSNCIGNALHAARAKCHCTSAASRAKALRDDEIGKEIEIRVEGLVFTTQ